MTIPVAYLMAYFTPDDDDGEQIRLAVSDVDDPTRWSSLNDGRPILTTTVGEHGARDPFLLWDPRRERYVIIATDLRTHHDGDWARAVRHGSTGILVWESRDLETWTGPHRREIAPPGAGNTWAPKAFFDDGLWHVIWAAAVYAPDDDRTDAAHQRLYSATTTDFHQFTAPQVYLDPGHDVIDATFLQDGETWYRFSANAHAPGNPAHVGHHIFMEKGHALNDPEFVPVAVDIGKPELERGEGPSVFTGPDDQAYLLIDEFGGRGYQLFTTSRAELPSGSWTHVPGASLPANARHGSVITIPIEQRDALLKRFR